MTVLRRYWLWNVEIEIRRLGSDCIFMSKHSLILIAILGVAAFFRLWQLGNVPASPSLDEVSIGYNAYSLQQTGMDEFGTKFPIILRAYDDWRPALYVYFVIPFVWMMGLSAVSVRMPSVIVSILSVWATYELAKELVFSDALSHKSHTTYGTVVGLVSAFLLAISPWHIYISRLGHEANAGLAFFVFGGMFFLKKRYVACSICYALSFMSYQSEKIVVPLIVAGIVVLFYKQLWKDKMKLIIPAIIAISLITPFVIASLQPDALIRFTATGVIRPETPVSSIPGIVFWQYISHFNPVWLFSNGGADAHKVPRLGILYWWEGLFALSGIVWLIRRLMKERHWRKAGFIFLWLLIGAVPAAITSGAPHVMRSMTSLPVWQVLAALGIYGAFMWFGRFSKMVVVAVGLLVLWSISGLFTHYFHTFPNEQSESFQYALSKAIPYVRANEQAYDRIVFSNEKHLYQSYMFFLFYSLYDPVMYQEQGGTVSGGYAETHSFGKYEFRPVDGKHEPVLQSGKTLYIGNIDDFPENTDRLTTFTSLSGDETIIAVER